MLKINKSILLVILAITLFSCDAMLHMTYTVENKTKNEITVFIPNFPTDSTLSFYSKRKDTILILKPNGKVVVGIGSKIDFPWGTKNIYKTQPGVCGIKRINNDTIIELGCSNSEWKYKRRNSNLKIKTNR